MTSFTLGLSACLSLLLDQTGMALLPYLPMLRGLGRIAFPLTCYLCGYAIRRGGTIRLPLLLFAAALFTELPFNLLCVTTAVAPLEQNPLFAIALGTLCAYILRRWTLSLPEQGGLMLLCLLISMGLGFRYGWLGPALIPAFAGSPTPRTASERGAILLILYSVTLLVTGVDLTWAVLSLCALFSLPLILFHRRSPVPVYLILFYPLLLLLLLLLRSAHLISPYYLLF